MSTDESTIQKLVKKAASLLKKAPMLTVPQAMRAANFSSAQSTNPALQMRIRRMLSNPKFAIDAPPTTINTSSPMPTISTLSTPPEAPSAANGNISVTDG